LRPVKIYRNLSEINALSHDAAAEAFLFVSGSKPWAEAMAGLRPFSMLEHLFSGAESVWQSLSEDEWKDALEARRMSEMTDHGSTGLRPVETALRIASTEHLEYIEAGLAGLLERMPREPETDENYDLA
jgi:hypothetical protein